MPRKLDFMHVSFVQLKYEWHIKITVLFANQKSDWIKAIYNQFDPASFLCLSQVKTLISNVVFRDLVCVQMGGDCSFS
jgi:hypothetical protein